MRIMLEMHLRQAATVLLESAIRIAPPDTRDWGRAMRGELNHVEGPWAATMWALGGSSVLAKQPLHPSSFRAAAGRVMFLTEGFSPRVPPCARRH